LRRHRLRRLLISDRAFDDCPIDAPRTALGRRFAFRRRRRGDFFEAAIDHRFKRIEFGRRPITPIPTIAVAAFAERLAALAAPRSTIAIAAFAIARLTFARLAFTRLTLAALAAFLTAAALTATPRAVTSLAIAAAFTALALATLIATAAFAARAIAIAPATPARATLAALLLLLAGLCCLRRAPLTGRCSALGPRTTAATPTAARTIAARQIR
jgi:hypothetical protein